MLRWLGTAWPSTGTGTGGPRSRPLPRRSGPVLVVSRVQRSRPVGLWASGRLVQGAPGKRWPNSGRRLAIGRWPATAGSSTSATPTSTGRWAASRSTAPSSAWPAPPTGTATGRWPATAASSATATPPSTDRGAACRSTAPSSAWRPRRTAPATGRWPATAGSSATATPCSTDRGAVCRSTAP